MEALINRYRSLTVLLVVVLAQLVGVAYQVKTNTDDRLIRVWAVTAVTPMTGIVEAVRHNTIGFLQDYFILLDVREQDRKLKADNDKLRMENVYFRNQLATAENARALLAFQSKTPSKTVAARVIGNSTVVAAKAVFIDRGTTSGVHKGMAVVTPEGIVGKVTAAYPLVSQVLLVTDPTFSVGVESQKGHVHGVLNCGVGKCEVEQIQNEDKVSVGEWFFTSGEDRIFPKGFPVGTVISSDPGQGTRDVKINLSGSPGGIEEVLVVLQGVHTEIPTAPASQDAVALLPKPPDESGADSEGTGKPQTQADKVLEHYSALGKQENHVYGAYGSNMPDFNPKAKVATAAQSGGAPPAAAAPLATPRPTAESAGAQATATTPSTAGILGGRPPAKPGASGTSTVPNEPALLGSPHPKHPPSEDAAGAHNP